jgi:hypothetical protein
LEEFVGKIGAARAAAMLASFVGPEALAAFLPKIKIDEERDLSISLVVQAKAEAKRQRRNAKRLAIQSSTPEASK